MNEGGGDQPSRVIALSLKARGLTVTPAIPRSSTRRMLGELGQSLLDLSVAIAVQVVLLSWSTWVSVLLVILCVVFYANWEDGRMAAADGAGIMVALGLLVYLPVLAQLHSVRCVSAAGHSAAGAHVCAWRADATADASCACCACRQRAGGCRRSTILSKVRGRGCRFNVGAASHASTRHQ
jgi:hypothetical protein